MSVTFNFDSESFQRELKEKMEEAAKEKIREIVRKVTPNVKVSFEGSMEDNTLQVKLSGEQNEIDQARLALQQ